MSKLEITGGLGLAVLVGFFAGQLVPLQSTEANPARELIDAASQSMYVHKDACAQKYLDGLEIANEINSKFLQQKFLLMEGYVTDTDYAITKEVWLENCMWHKEVYEKAMGR